MKITTLLAVVATGLIVVTGVNSMMRPPPRQQEGPAKKQAKKKPIAKASCTIKRATFGGTETALLRVQKENVTHYIVLDLPSDNPLASSYQSAWLDANYGSAEPSVIGVFPTVAAAVTRAASLCKRN